MNYRTINPSLLHSVLLASVILWGACVNHNADSFSKIDNYLSQGVPNGFNGAVMIYQNGEFALNKGYGLSDKSKNRLNSSSTIFDIGSNTKQFTGAAILKLVEDEKLNLDDSLTIFFKNLPADKRGITVHQLLTHTGGFQESIGGDFESTTTEQFFNDVWNSNLFKAPGSAFNYSNIGYSILARIIELTSGMDYEKYLQIKLFAPAGMLQTGYLLPNWDESKIAIGYNRNILDQGSTINRYKEDGLVSWHLKGNGGICSSNDDLLLWYKAIKSHNILSPASVEKWITPYVAELDNNKHFYGYGWGVVKTGDTIFVGHNGGNGAFSHSIRWSPQGDFLLLFASNTSSPKVENIAYTLMDLIFKTDYQAEPIEKNPYQFVMDFIGTHNIDEFEQLKNSIIEDRTTDFQNSDILNRLGYMNLGNAENINWAVELFYLNTELFPKDGNVWDSLGEAYEKINQHNKAKEAYQKAVDLGNSDSREKLKILEDEAKAIQLFH